jgi:ferredoxin-thioredoxin reductase catalytic subunit
LNEFGTCFCGLYVSAEVVKGKKKATSIPERRPKEEERKS